MKKIIYALIILAIGQNTTKAFVGCVYLPSNQQITKQNLDQAGWQTNMPTTGFLQACYNNRPSGYKAIYVDDNKAYDLSNFNQYNLETDTLPRDGNYISLK